MFERAGWLVAPSSLTTNVLNVVKGNELEFSFDFTDGRTHELAMVIAIVGMGGGSDLLVEELTASYIALHAVPEN